MLKMPCTLIGYQFLIFICLLFSSSTYATKLGYSEVTFTNNSQEIINVKTDLITDDPKFKRGRDWQGLNTTLAPYESKRVLWFSRHNNLQKNKKYTFTLALTQASYPGYPLSFNFNEKSKKVYGSYLTTEVIFPDNSSQKLFEKSSFQTYARNFWEKNYLIRTRHWLPKLNVFHNFHFILDLKEKNILQITSPQQLNILTYNAKLMPFYVGIEANLNNPERRANAIPREINFYDVVIMEELFDRELRKTLEQGMQTYYPYKTKLLKGDKTLLSGGVIIFSKWPIIKEAQTVYRAKTGFDAFAAKGAVYALINKKGQYFNFIGTHLQAGNSSEEKRARQKQLQELANFIALLNIPNNQPFLIGGDFNIAASSPDINYLMATLNVNLIKNIGYPYSSDGTINSMHMGGDQVRIDYIFSSRNALAPKNEFNNIYILRALGDQKMWPNFDLSDHFPVAGFFDFGN